MCQPSRASCHLPSQHCGWSLIPSKLCEPRARARVRARDGGWGSARGSEWETSLSDASGDVGLSWDTWMDHSLLWRRSHNRLSNCCCPLSGCATHLSQTQALNHQRPLWFLKRTHFLPYDDTYTSCVSSVSNIKNRTTTRKHTHILRFCI